MTLEAEAPSQLRLLVQRLDRDYSPSPHSHVAPAVDVAEDAHDWSCDDGRNARLDDAKSGASACCLQAKEQDFEAGLAAFTIQIRCPAVAPRGVAIAYAQTAGAILQSRSI